MLFSKEIQIFSVSKLTQYGCQWTQMQKEEQVPDPDFSSCGKQMC